MVSGRFPGLCGGFLRRTPDGGVSGRSIPSLRRTTNSRLISETCCRAVAIPAFLGALVGYVLPLLRSRHARQRQSSPTSPYRSAIAAIVQVLAYLVARLVMPDVSKRITNNDISAGLLLGGIALAFGLINAAAMTP